MNEDKLADVLNEDGCPQCNSLNVKPVGYTWWGGVIGPRLLKHTKCSNCKFTFNRNTRKSNTTPIIIYSIVLAAIGFAIIFMFR